MKTFNCCSMNKSLANFDPHTFCRYSTLCATSFSIATDEFPKNLFHVERI